MMIDELKPSLSTPVGNAKTWKERETTSFLPEIFLFGVFFMDYHSPQFWSANASLSLQLCWNTLRYSLSSPFLSPCNEGEKEKEKLNFQLSFFFVLSLSFFLLFFLLYKMRSPSQCSIEFVLMVLFAPKKKNHHEENTERDKKEHQGGETQKGAHKTL